MAKLEEIAMKIAFRLRIGDIITMNGDLGSGKTTFVRMLICALYPGTKVTSPTFGLLQTYPHNDSLIWHFDLYLSPSIEHICNAGLLEALQTGITIIEWPEKVAHLISPKDRLQISLSCDGNPDTRNLQLNYGSQWAERVKEIIKPTC